MIDPTHPLPIVRQARLLDLSRSSVYYRPQPTPEGDLALMRRLDGFKVGRQHVGTLMAKMGIAALSRQRNTSAPHPAHPIYPYLLKGLTIDRPNQCWAADITYIPMRRGFVYLVAIVDWATRRMLAHRVSISMSTDFCVEALEEAITRYGRPEIFNTDQGSQFTSAEFTGVLKAHDIRISMDGKGRWIDNVFVERIWKSVKYEHVYLHAYENVAEARQQLATYFSFYNTRRSHSSLGGRTPDMTYFGEHSMAQAA
jgi:putative transposase